MPVKESRSSKPAILKHQKSLSPNYPPNTSAAMALVSHFAQASTENWRTALMRPVPELQKYDIDTKRIKMILQSITEICPNGCDILPVHVMFGISFLRVEGYTLGEGLFNITTFHVSVFAFCSIPCERKNRWISNVLSMKRPSLNNDVEGGHRVRFVSVMRITYALMCTSTAQPPPDLFTTMLSGTRMY